MSICLKRRKISNKEDKRNHFLITLKINKKIFKFYKQKTKNKDKNKEKESFLAITLLNKERTKISVILFKAIRATLRESINICKVQTKSNT